MHLFAMARWLYATALALLLVACQVIPSQDASPPSPPTPALDAWRDFPANSSPRPVVWLAKNSPSNGFDGTSKMAFFCNKYVLADGLHLPPDTPGQATAQWRSGMSNSYPAISARRAFAAMTRPPTDLNIPYCPTAQPLTVTAVRLGTYGFGTDRGTAEVTAWLFTATGARGEVAYPAVASSSIWGDGMAQNLGSTVTVSPDERTLTYTFYGTPANAGTCSADYTGAVAESSTAVAIAVKSIPRSGPNAGGVCLARPMLRSVTLKLNSALAGRVVVDSHSSAVWVCPTGSSNVRLPGGAIARC